MQAHLVVGPKLILYTDKTINKYLGHELFISPPNERARERCR